MDKKICQLVDSAGSLPKEFSEQYNIHTVPFYFKFNDTDYLRENIDLAADEFYQHMLDFPDDAPKTSAPNIHDWLSVLEEQYAKGFKKYIVTTISSKLSASFQTATAAKNIFQEKYRDVLIEVINSNTCACGQAALEIGIAKMIARDREFKDIVETIPRIAKKINSLFVVNSLTYMKAGGRIGGATAFLGKLLDIKPVCEFIDGTVHPIKAARGRKQSLRAIIDIAVARIADFNQTIICIQNAECREDAEYLYNYLQEKSNSNCQIFNSSLGITVGAHSGPGALGIGFLELS